MKDLKKTASDSQNALSKADNKKMQLRYNILE